MDIQRTFVGWVAVIIALIGYQPALTNCAQNISSRLDAGVLRIASSQNPQEPIIDRDNGGGLTFREDLPRLDRFAKNLSESKDATGYIFAYGDVRGPKSQASRRLGCIRKYLMKSHQIDPARLVMLDSGYRSEIEVELFVVRPQDPKPEPFPTTNRSAVRHIKTSKRRCG